MNTAELYDLKSILSERIGEKLPNFNKHWNDITHSLGIEFVDCLKENLKPAALSLFEIHKFKFSVVVDNNFVLGQIMGFVDKGKSFEESFIYRLINASYIDVFGPHKLKKELRDKIDQHIKKDKKKAHEYADEILKKIKIRDAQWVCEWKKAQDLIGHIDEDDVPYLALSFHTESHAIISGDKVFGVQSESKVWDMRDAGRIITNYNAGFISFCFLGGVKDMIVNLFKVLMVILKELTEFIIGIITEIGRNIKDFLISLNNGIPDDVKFLLLLFAGVALITSEKFREFTADAISKIAEFVKFLFKKFVEFMNIIFNGLKTLYEAFKPLGITVLEVLEFFLTEWLIMREEVKKLEEQRAAA